MWYKKLIFNTKIHCVLITFIFCHMVCFYYILAAALEGHTKKYIIEIVKVAAWVNKERNIVDDDNSQRKLQGANYNCWLANL